MSQIGAAALVSTTSTIPVKWIIVSVVNFVCMLFRNQSPSVLIPALRTVGNIVTGDDLQTQVISCHHL